MHLDNVKKAEKGYGDNSLTYEKRRKIRKAPITMIARRTQRPYAFHPL